MPTLGFWFRRYAPFARFGNIGMGNFEGDNRGPSTSLSVTSRTYCCVMFDESGITHSFSNSSGTTFYPYVGSPVHGMSTVHHQVSRTMAAGPGLLEFEAHSEGGNPLVPKSPDIDTFVRVRFDWLPGVLKVEGEASGDNFPALEIFLYSYVTKNTALLFDGSTTGGPNVGPAKRLFGSHKSHVLGRFRGLLTLDASRDLAMNYTVPKAKMPDY